MYKYMILTFMSLSIVGCSDSKDTAAEVTKNAVKLSKELLGGVSEGIDEGRKESQGIDGAIVVTNIDELLQHVDMKIIRVTGQNKNTFTEIEVGFKNKIDKPVRIANLDDKQTVLLLDKEGYAQTLDEGNRRTAELTIPPKAGIKHYFQFNVPLSDAKILRLWNREFEIKNIPIIKEHEEPEEKST